MRWKRRKKDWHADENVAAGSIQIQENEIKKNDERFLCCRCYYNSWLRCGKEWCVHHCVQLCSEYQSKIELFAGFKQKALTCTSNNSAHNIFFDKIREHRRSNTMMKHTIDLSFWNIRTAWHGSYGVVKRYKHLLTTNVNPLSNGNRKNTDISM